MNSEFQNRLYNMEVMPPGQVWDKLSLDLDEINADKLIADRLGESSVLPSPFVWEKINASLNDENKSSAGKVVNIFSWKKLALAAVFSGLAISVWLIFFNPQKNDQEIVTTNIPAPSIQENKTNPQNKEQNKPLDAQINPSQPVDASIATNKKNTDNKTAYASNYPVTQKPVTVLKTGINFISLSKEKPGNKVFNQPIDDLSMIATDENYMTMVTTNGRIVKIPAHLAHLAPLLQDKPITEDFYELMFGEKAFWKEKMNDWRQKLATSPVSSGDLFSNMVELLKSENDRTDNPVRQGK